MIRVEIKPELLSWARERAGYDPGALAHRFPKLAAWEQGTATPTLRSEGDKNFYESKCATLDRQIDQLVNELYDLTDDEIAIVEEAKK